MSANNNSNKRGPSKSAAAPANKQPRSSSQPGEEESADEETYFIDEILDKQIIESRIMYKIKWKNFPLPKDQTWEPIECIRNDVETICNFEENPDRPYLETTEIKADLVAQYRQATIDEYQMDQVLALDTVNHVIYVKWTNAMVTPFQLKELDSVLIHAIVCLVHKDFEKLFDANKKAIDQKVKTLIEKFKEQAKSDDNQEYPTQDEIRGLSDSIENLLRLKEWPVLSVEGGEPSRIMVNPLHVTRDRTDYGHVILQCAICDTCGAYYERANVAFFEHLRQSKHNGNYLGTF